MKGCPLISCTKSRRLTRQHDGAAEWHAGWHAVWHAVWHGGWRAGGWRATARYSKRSGQAQGMVPGARFSTCVTPAHVRMMRWCEIRVTLTPTPTPPTTKRSAWHCGAPCEAASGCGMWRKRRYAADSEQPKHALFCGTWAAAARKARGSLRRPRPPTRKLVRRAGAGTEARNCRSLARRRPRARHAACRYPPFPHVRVICSCGVRHEHSERSRDARLPRPCVARRSWFELPRAKDDGNLLTSKRLSGTVELTRS